MPRQSLNGDQALALGALSSGIKMVTSYPGSPSSDTVAALLEAARKHGIYVEWSSNEKVAMEMGIGASIAGCRALVCVKSVGMNAMIDPLMALNLTPVHGGLVILLGDDPGGYGSQNDQDSRPLASFLEMPMLEPSDPAEGYEMMTEAFRISEQYKSAVILRITRGFTQFVQPVEWEEKGFPDVNLGLNREPFRFVPVPKNAVEKHRELHKRIESLSRWADKSTFNAKTGLGTTGIIASGFSYQKLLDSLGGHASGVNLLKLGTIYPLPCSLLISFMEECLEVLVVEENEPYLEVQIKALAQEAGLRTRIQGKLNGKISREGELFRWQIQEALSSFLPDIVPGPIYDKKDEDKERPEKTNHCAECGYGDILEQLQAAAEELELNPVIVGDPGCLVTVAESLDAKYAMGSAVGVADGLRKAGIREKAIAVFGDSAFFHTALPAVCNAVHNRSDILMVILDNKATAASGFQPHPGVGKNAFGNEAPALDIEKICRACGVNRILPVNMKNQDRSLVEVFKKALENTELTLIIIKLNK
jgi:indolepyruvate ferredoxin oxidoreductase alpha subunit